MVRPQQALGRTGTPVIPAGWSTAPRVVIAGTRTGACSLRHPGVTPKGTFDPSTGDYPDAVADAAYWSGSCRVQASPVFGGGAQDAAGEPVTTATYLVTVDLDADDPADEIRIGDVLTVTGLDANGDPTLVGRPLTVQSIARGTLMWERDLVCVDQMSPSAVS